MGIFRIGLIILIGILVVKVISSSSFIQDSPFGLSPAMPYDEAKKIGVQWTRGGDFPYLFWSIVDPEKTGDPVKFQWEGITTGPDGQPAPFNYNPIFDVQKSGLSLMHNIQPEPIPENYSQPGSWLPIDETAYRNFVKEAVRRYSFINYWQVGNEPNFGGARNLSDFAELQRITYEAIKEANPQAQVLIGGVAGNMDIKSMNDTYFESILLELQGKSLDIFDIHFYGDAKGGELGLLGYQDFKTVYDYFRNLLDNNGFSHVPIWVTEMGTFSGTLSDGLQQTESEQAIDLLKRWVYPLSLGVKKIFWGFGLMEGFGPWDDDFFDHTGLIYGGQDGVHQLGEKKLGYYTFWLMTDKLEGSDWNNIQVIQESDNIYIYEFTKQGKPIWVAWNDNPSSEQIIISGIGSAQAKVTEAIPEYESGKEVTDYSTAFKSEAKSVENDELILTLEDIPMFIERA